MSEPTLREKLDAAGFCFQEPSMTDLLNIIREHAAAVARNEGVRLGDRAGTVQRCIAEALETMK